MKEWIEATGIAKILSILSRSTGDYYYIYSHRERMIYLSENVKESNRFIFSKTKVTLQEWNNKISFLDKERLLDIMVKIVDQQQTTYNVNYRMCNVLGEYVWVNSRGSACYDENHNILYIMGSLRPNHELERMKVSNLELLKEEIRRNLYADIDGYLLVIGVDNLKSINLRNGRKFGDSLLCHVNEVLYMELPDKQEIYRINGDWYAINFMKSKRERVEDFFHRVQADLEGECTVSGGCVSYKKFEVHDEGMLLQYAEIALESSKNKGKNQLSYFSLEDYEAKIRQLDLHAEIQKAIVSKFEGFSLVYQPQFMSETYLLYGAEALLRFDSVRYGRISPGELIPILEQCGFISDVGLWVIQEALKVCKIWRKFRPDFHISVNMSYCQLEKNTVADEVLHVLYSSGLPGNALTIEVTESMQLSNYPELNRIFQKWEQKGIQISVDDFGTGYSSLGHLKKLSVDEIKIDQCFVKGIQNSVYNYRLLSNILELAEGSQLRVCCEGVETVEELAVLTKLSPSLLQGFLFSRPLQESEFEERFIQNAYDPDFEMEENQPMTGAEMERFTAEEITRTILEAENDVFYLSDLETNKLYYLNMAGKKIFSAPNYYGKKCHEIFYRKDTPCSFCKNRLLRCDSFYVWENQNTYCGRQFLLKEKIIDYNGKKMKLGVALDITKDGWKYFFENSSTNVAGEKTEH